MTDVGPHGRGERGEQFLGERGRPRHGLDTIIPGTIAQNRERLHREFYDSRLFVVPSPTTITAMHGLHFRLVKGGVFDRGGTATNRVEARAVAEAVVEHARRHPKQSLGVGAFSVSQRDAIRDELEVLQREHGDLASFFSTGRPEPFFVKNLENIQGDERDVIFISVGYARELVRLHGDELRTACRRRAGSGG